MDTIFKWIPFLSWFTCSCSNETDEDSIILDETRPQEYDIEMGLNTPYYQLKNE